MIFRYFIFVLFLLISFISDKSISSETSGSKDDPLRCAGALSNKLETFTLPEALKPFGASNIEIEESPVNEMAERAGYKPRVLGFHATFTVNRQQRTILFSIGRPTANDTFDSTIILEELKNVFGGLPERFLTQLMYQIDRIEYEHRDINRGGMLLGSTSHQLYSFDRDVGDNFDQNTIKVYSFSNIAIWYGLGRIMALYNGDTMPDQKWRDAALEDNVKVSEYGDTQMAKRIPILTNNIRVFRDAKTVESFAQAFMLYIKTNGGILYPQIARRYAHRFKILDEVVGVNPSEREGISEINRLFETQTNDLLKKLGLSAVRTAPTPEEGFLDAIHLNTHITEELMSFWRTHPHHIEISKVLADKVQNLRENRSLDPNLFKKLLSQIQNHILFPRFWIEDNGEIPKFITETIYQLDIFSIEEIERRLRILEQLDDIFSDENREDYITFEQALQEAQGI